MAASTASHETPTINANSRGKLGTRECRRLRKMGRLPAVIYGHKQDPVAIDFDEKEISDIMRHHAHVIDVKIDGDKSEHCLFKATQWNHLGNQVLHLDLTRIDINERVTLELELEYVGDAPGLKEGGAIMEHPITVLEIECLASKIPESLEADISEMQMGDTLTAGGVKLPDGMTLVSDPDAVVATITENKATLIEDEVAADDSDAAPEVIGESKDNEDSAEG